MNTFIDLFAGIGGFRLALEARGLTCVFSSEIDKFARQTYSANFGHEPHGDITKIDAKDIPQHDVLCAGFPCQSFSIAGKRQGMNEARGQLFHEIIRIAKYHRPKVLLLENVPNILRIEGGAVIREIGRLLDEAGYVMQYSILNASNYGIPQARKRVYFVCIRKGLNYSYMRPSETYERVYLRNYIDFGVTTGFVEQETEIKQVTACGLMPIRVGTFNRGSQGDRIYSLQGHAVSQSANGGGIGANTGLYVMDAVDPKYTLGDKTWACLQKAKSFGYNMVDADSSHTNTLLGTYGKDGKGILVCQGKNYTKFTPFQNKIKTLTARYGKDGKEALVDQGNKNPRKLTPRECARV